MSSRSAVDPLAVIERRWPMVGRTPRGPAGAQGGGGTVTTYDSVYALWPCEPDVPQCGWGCSARAVRGDLRRGVSSISTDHWRTLLTDPDPEQGYVHEWLHQVEAVYRALGVSETESRRFTTPASSPRRDRRRDAIRSLIRGVPRSGARTWAPWYHDWMTGRLVPAERPPPPTDADGPRSDRPDIPARWARRTSRLARVAGPYFSVDLYKGTFYMPACTRSTSWETRSDGGSSSCSPTAS